MRQAIGWVIASLLLVALASTAWAGKVVVKPDGSTQWQAGVDGIVIEWEPDGSIRDVTSTDSAAVEFPDREGIYKARIIAEERAKAHIVRFMNQAVSSSRVVSTIDNDLSKATRERQSGSKANVSSVDSRTLISSLAEVTTSFAEKTLPGVIVLAQHYSPRREQYTVTVGYSRKTMHAAAELRRMTTESSQSSVGTSSESPAPAGASSNKWLHQPASSSTYPNGDWK